MALGQVILSRPPAPKETDLQDDSAEAERIYAQVPFPDLYILLKGVLGEARGTQAEATWHHFPRRSGSESSGST